MKVYWCNEWLERKFLGMPRRYSAWRFTKRRQCLYAGCVPLERVPPVPQLEDGALSLGTVLILPLTLQRCTTLSAGRPHGRAGHVSLCGDASPTTLSVTRGQIIRCYVRRSGELGV